MTARAKIALSMLLMTFGAAIARRATKQEPTRAANLVVHALAPESPALEWDLERLGPSALEERLDQLEHELRSPGPAFPSPARSPSPTPADGVGLESGSEFPEPAGGSKSWPQARRHANESSHRKKAA
ncbi:MAG TPA: hypothetical protein VG937_05995 [Polyangiaceae bacterium]|jgi:hypothetical protein|nr:hypothetical protein [Polyangiaceae bacterium]